MKFSIIIPVYNEKETVAQIIERVNQAGIKHGLDLEIIVVNDGSTDGSGEILGKLHKKGLIHKYHILKTNQGKGGAIKMGLSLAEGDFILIQDADLEYCPEEYHLLFAPILGGEAQAVFGSRYLRDNQRNFYSPPNVILTQLFNLFFKTKITDVSTCYKVFPRSLKEDLLKIADNDFVFDVFHLTFLIAKKKLILKEVPISYSPRSYRSGKKLKIKHGLRVFFAMLRQKISG